jgi:hypothetical protein
MTLTKAQQKMVLAALVAGIVLLNVYYYLTADKPRTAPLAYAPGAVASSPVRPGLSSRTSAAADPLAVFLERREEKFPGVQRDIFRMENPAPRTKPTPTVVTAVTPTIPLVPAKTPEEIAEDLARADLSKFRFLGFLTDKDNTLFLSKEGELFMVKSGDKVLKNYRIKEAGKDYVLLVDTITKVEVRVELSGSEPVPAAQQRGR